MPKSNIFSLKRYNGAVNELFTNRRPNLVQFAAGILKEAQEWTKFLTDATTPTIATKEYQTAAVKLLPNSYKRYQLKNDKRASTMRKFNKKKHAKHKKAAFGRMVNDVDSTSDSTD